jgi:hypothetical protein
LLNPGNLSPHFQDRASRRGVNTPVGHGFYPCDERGNETEPSKGSGWNGLYVCDKCGRIIWQETLEVIGQNPDHTRLP